VNLVQNMIGGILTVDEIAARTIMAVVTKRVFPTFDHASSSLAASPSSDCPRAR
jgi:hypothetical protein